MRKLIFAFRNFTYAPKMNGYTAVLLISIYTYRD